MYDCTKMEQNYKKSIFYTPYDPTHQQHALLLLYFYDLICRLPHQSLVELLLIAIVCLDLISKYRIAFKLLCQIRQYLSTYVHCKTLYWSLYYLSFLLFNKVQNFINIHYTLFSDHRDSPEADNWYKLILFLDFLRCAFARYFILYSPNPVDQPPANHKKLKSTRKLETRKET